MLCSCDACSYADAPWDAEKVPAAEVRAAVLQGRRLSQPAMDVVTDEDADEANGARLVPRCCTAVMLCSVVVVVLCSCAC